VARRTKPSSQQRKPGRGELGDLAGIAEWAGQLWFSTVVVWGGRRLCLSSEAWNGVGRWRVVGLGVGVNGLCSGVNGGFTTYKVSRRLQLSRRRPLHTQLLEHQQQTESFSVKEDKKIIEDIKRLSHNKPMIKQFDEAQVRQRSGIRVRLTRGSSGASSSAAHLIYIYVYIYM